MAEAIKLDVQRQPGQIPHIYSGDFQLLDGNWTTADIVLLKNKACREPANKSSVFSAGYRTARCTKGSAVKCLDLSKLPDTADGRYRARPSGLSEQRDIRVNGFRRTTSMPVIAALISHRSASQRRKGFVRRFLRLSVLSLEEN